MGAGESTECPGCPVSTWCPGQARVIMCGPPRSGKTVVLEQLKHDAKGPSPRQDQAKVGFVVETIVWKKMNLTVWDVGSHGGFKRLHRPYFKGTEAIVLVLDSSAPEQLPLLREELAAMLQEDELREARVLVLANKQDLDGAMPPAKIKEHLALESCGRPWHVQPCCASSGSGLDEGLQWLVESLPAHTRRSPCYQQVCCLGRKGH